MHTSCPTPNQPAENLTAPGSILSVDIFATKLSLLTCQLGVLSMIGESSLTDFFKRGYRKVVAILMVDCFEKG